MGKPLPWGNKIDSAIKDKYLADGYVYQFCVSFFFCRLFSLFFPTSRSETNTSATVGVPVFFFFFFFFFFLFPSFF
jgi:hypothetical protein